MKLPLSWIKEYVNINVSADEYRSRMILAGDGIEGVEEPGAEISNVVVGRIESIRKHANSDHLLICRVDVGGEALQIVTGAPNVFEGAYVPVALHGAFLPGGKSIKRGKLRGEVSEGMLCSGSELNVPDALYPGAGVDGILIFNEPHPPGADVRPILGIDDTIIDFEVLANRPDCLCAWGIARESAAVLGTEFRKPEIKVKTSGGNIGDFASVDVRDGALCPRYTACAINNARVAPSPMWMRKALNGAGMRSINNIVDITNYVMLETGHPMHAFDLDKVRGRRIIVRRASPGETLRTLDEKERTLTCDMLVIADAEGATGLAGIMGGEESEITQDTKVILFECAAFDRTSVRLTSRALGMRTESSGRFEKGVTPETVRTAMLRACQLVNLLNAGDVVGESPDNGMMIDLYPNPSLPAAVRADCARIRERIGVDVPDERMAEILRALHFGVSLDGGALTAMPPAFRQDVDQEADLAEEIIRLYGYHHLKPTLPIGAGIPGKRSERMRMTDSVKAFLRAWGGNETLAFSFVSPASLEKLGLPAGDLRLSPVAIRNPLGEDTKVMRTTLVPSMLDALALNQSRKNEACLLFETGAAFETIRGGAQKKEGELPWERQTLCIGAYGASVDFYEMRGIVEALLKSFGIAAAIERGADAYYHPGRSARLTASGQSVAQLGEAHPDTAERFRIEGRVYIAEIDLDALAALAVPAPPIRELPRHPAVSRDVALTMDESVPLGGVRDAIENACGPLLESASLFDVYRGARLGGKKSAAFSLRFRAPDRTLTDEEVDKIFERMLSSVEEQYGAEIRK
ncbi:MAG: phenylalanine--tRNA ligase subunit beta [Oscillospiraceae bacterium]|jgi:phenylalanyl-tRNA synthetase beta chain|nr:phenylalanine--tRNA ligase subunit beta [Oscillospiraceae bacterium]